VETSNARDCFLSVILAATSAALVIATLIGSDDHASLVLDYREGLYDE
jgi:hypothetical protein